MLKILFRSLSAYISYRIMDWSTSPCWCHLCFWIAGRQSWGRLQSSSRALSSMLRVLYKTVHILHDSCPRYPLGKTMCAMDVHWMFMSLHATADRPETHDESIVVWCPRCRRTFSHWMYAAVRYSYKGQLEVAAMFLSEQQETEASDIEDSQSNFRHRTFT